MAIHIFVICLVVLGLQNIISITIHKKRFSKQVDELQKLSLIHISEPTRH